MRKRTYTEYARPRTRLVNFIVDNLVFNLSTFALVVGIGSILALGGQSSLLDAFASIVDGVSGKILFVIAYLAYYTLTESIWGKSPAKFLTKTRVVHLGGGQADWMVLFGRSLTRLIPLEPVSFLFGANWHDRFSNTFVVYDD